MERELQASSQHGESFGSTKLARAAHGITATAPTHTNTGRGPASTDYMAQLDGNFDNLAAATTNSGAALNQLAATTRMQYAEIKSLLTALKTASIPSSYAATVATDSTPSIHPAEAKCSISQLEADI